MAQRIHVIEMYADYPSQFFNVLIVFTLAFAAFSVLVSSEDYVTNREVLLCWTIDSTSQNLRG